MTDKQKPHYDFNMLYGNVLDKKLSPIQAIRHYCWYCCGGHEDPWEMSDGTFEPPLRPFDEVKECSSTSCYLFPFRTGRDPARAGKGGNKKNLRNIGPDGKRKENADALRKHRGT